MVPSLPSRLRRPPVLDIAVAAGLTGLLLVVSPRIPADPGQRAIDAGACLLIVVAGATLAFRRVVPRAALAIISAAVAVFAVANFAGGPVYVTPLIALGTLAYLDGRRAAALPGVLLLSVLVVAGLVGGRSDLSDPIHLLLLSWAIAAVLIGDGIRTRAQHIEETKEEEARRRVAEERVRIARDLHDVVAHSLASISIQAGMGAHVIDRQPEEARAALLAIKAASREALDELRGTLDVLREGSAPTAPTPGLASLSTLTTAPSQAGLRVTLEVRGLDDRHLPAALDATAYRIVQESLTNVMRHARATSVAVRVVVDGEHVDLEVVDDGAGAVRASEGGHGLVGMRERAALVGGWVTAGPRVDARGFRVHAQLPLARPTADQAGAAS